MSADAVSDEDLAKVLCLAESCDPNALELTPVQGFLFSRIDGQTSWRLLREIGGVAPGDVDVCLRQWLADGLLVGAKSASTKAPTRPKARAKKRAARKPGKQAAEAVPEEPKPKIDESRLDDSLDISEEVQRSILEFEAGLDASYYEILGVERDGDARDFKRAYFRLSKEFHPDRYFRRNIGDYAKCLDCIFKKILEAHELLSDPTTRAEVDKSMPPPASPAAVTAEAADSSSGKSSSEQTARKRPLTPIERLKQRMPFKISPERMAQRRSKAAEFYHSALVSARGGRFLEAASSARLAIAFDPSSAEYKRSFAEIQAQAAQARVRELLERDDASMDHVEQSAALALYEDTLMYRPHDPVVNNRAALLAISLGHIEKAREYAERAVEHSPQEGVYHRTLGRVFKAQGDRGHAVREVELALKYDRNDGEARELLTALKPRQRRA